MHADGGNRPVRKLPAWLIPAIGYAMSIGCLVWVYRGFDWHGELARMRETDWRWISVAAVADVVVYITQGYRWNLLIRPVGRMPVMRSIQAIYIGLFANEVLPLRPGEVIRCYLQSRWSRIPISVSLSSAAVERLLDGVWLVVGFYLALVFMELPKALEYAAGLLAAVIGIASVLLLLAAMHKERARNAVKESRWSVMLHHLIDGLHNMARSRTFLAAFALSLVYFVLQVLPVYALIRAYDLDLGVGAAAVVLIILRIGSIPPQAPGNVGSFQALTVAGLRLFGVDRTFATGYATLLFIVVTVPLWVVGFIALLATRMRLDDLHDSARSATRH